MSHANRSLVSNERSMKQPIQWVQVTRALTLMGFMEGSSHEENRRVAKLLQDRIDAGKVKRLKRGLYQKAD